MPRLSSLQAATLDRVKLAVDDATSAPALASRLLAILQPALQFDEAVLMAVDDRSMLFTRLLAYVGHTFERFVDWLRDLYLVGEPTDLADIWFPNVLSRYGGVVVMHERADRWLGGVPPPRDASRWAAYWRASGSPPGGGIWFGIADRGRWVAALLAARWEPGPGLERHDVELLRRAAPSVARAFAARLAPSRLGDSQTGMQLPTRGHLVFGADRRLALADTEGEAWIGRLPEDGLAVHGMPAPVAIQSVVNFVARTAEPTSLRLTDVEGLGVEVKAKAMHDAKGGFPSANARGWVHVAIGPEPILGRLAGKRLTRRQHMVALAIATGSPDRVVATSLGISIATLRQHVLALHDAFGTRTRPQLVAVLTASTDGRDRDRGLPAVREAPVRQAPVRRRSNVRPA